MKRLAPLVLALAVTIPAGAVLGHSGVKDPQVKARMDLMMDVAASTKVLGEMAKGATAFDAARAEVARARLQAAAGEIPALFKAPATDPKSEAKPEIWSNWQDFVARAEAMGTAAGNARVDSLANLRAGMKEIGQSCGACHQRYKTK